MMHGKNMNKQSIIVDTSILENLYLLPIVACFLIRKFSCPMCMCELCAKKAGDEREASWLKSYCQHVHPFPQLCLIHRKFLSF